MNPSLAHPDMPARISRYLDGDLTADEHARLADWLGESPENAKQFMLWVALDHRLGQIQRRKTASDATPAPIARIAPAPRRWVRSFALAAALLLAVGGLAVVALPPSAPQPVTDGRPAAATLASVIDVAGGTLVIDGRVAAAGSQYPARTVSLDAGEADFLLPNLVGVKISGRSELTMHGDGSATLARGTARFECPPQAKGFTVDLPGAIRIVDLGTRFSAEASDGDDWLVSVEEGSVAIHDPGDTGSYPVVTLTEGESARYVAADHTLEYLGAETQLIADGGFEAIGTGGDVAGPVWTFDRSLAGFVRAGGRTEPGAMRLTTGDEKLIAVTLRLHDARLAGARVSFAAHARAEDAATIDRGSSPRVDLRLRFMDAANRQIGSNHESSIAFAPGATAAPDPYRRGEVAAVAPLQTRSVLINLIYRDAGKNAGALLDDVALVVRPLFRTPLTSARPSFQLRSQE